MCEQSVSNLLRSELDLKHHKPCLTLFHVLLCVHKVTHGSVRYHAPACAYTCSLLSRFGLHIQSFAVKLHVISDNISEQLFPTSRSSHPDDGWQVQTNVLATLQLPPLHL